MLSRIPSLKQYESQIDRIREYARHYYINTPLIHSLPLSKLINKPVYLKMDPLQPSGSFKDRGMSHLLSYEHYINNKHEFISSSGGNAGLAAATVANEMDVQCHVIVPKTTSNVAIERIKQQNAMVTIYGNNWNEADGYARELISKNRDKIAYIHPFDHPLLWLGHSTIVNEIITLDSFHFSQSNSSTSSSSSSSADSNNDKTSKSASKGPSSEDTVSSPVSSPAASSALVPDCIVCSVGGGGLLNGIALGILDNMEVCGNTTVITSETVGCDSFYQSFVKGEYVTLDAITSIANTLGARKVNDHCLEYCSLLETNVKKPVAEIVSDKQAVNAVKLFLDDHRILVEPACAASLALLYDEEKRGVFEPFSNVVVEVCGGSGTNIDILNGFCKKFGL